MVKPPAVVVFDVNIYVDLAELITQPFEWHKLESAAAAHWNDLLPHNDNARYDSLRAVLMSRTGAVSSGEALEVWTSEPIDDLVIKKVHERAIDTSGVPWTLQNAIDFHDQLVNTLVFDMTRGGSAGAVPSPLNNPPLDYEDGRVMRTAQSSGDLPESPRYCITRDEPFREACRRKQLESTVQVLYPHEWIISLRRARNPLLRGR
ncbi:hypothetical protein A5709_15260 [Mycobacterium sp. E1386]|uniref:hypothetical protein n=1 Tax=Mycobacterium sp. E1386 TaxID=1834126 RepID=UPI000800529F|nr:hypothetical protein [Mycobacterium sp. E1386]OBI37188.1 hypothetical protein A5709_15260 [Mycobacterium sp. E1386]